MTVTLDSIHSYATKHLSSTKENNLNRNTAIGTIAGITIAGLLLTKGKLNNLPKMEYGIKEVMAICTGSALGGYIGANSVTSDNYKGRTLELKHQLIYNDLLPLVLLKGVEKIYNPVSKLKRSIVLAGSLLGFTYLGHYLAENSLKKGGYRSNYPVEACHLIAEADDYMLPIAIATKWKWLQNTLKVLSPVTFFPLGWSIGRTRDDKYIT